MIDPVFTAAVEATLVFEGGYVDDPADPGGETNFGISRRSYPTEDIACMTRDRAKTIYYTDYWLRTRINRLPDFIAPKVFDTAVLRGPVPAIRLLQACLVMLGSIGLVVDGQIGAVTLAACGIIQADKILAAYRAGLVKELEALIAAHPGEAKFRDGWERRALS